MSSIVRCAVCRKIIPAIDLEFGGPHIWLSVDGPVVCGPKCRDEWPRKLSRDLAPGGILGSDRACADYLMGRRDD